MCERSCAKAASTVSSRGRCIYLARADNLGDDIALANGNPEVEQSAQGRRHRSRGQRRCARVGPHLTVAEQA